MKKLFLSLAFLLPAMGMMAQTQVKTAEGILEGKDLWHQGFQRCSVCSTSCR